MTFEAILITTLLFVTVMFIANYAKQNQFLPRLVEEPWGRLAGMIENGTWDPPEQGIIKHPNHLDRHGTPLGDSL